MANNGLYVPGSKNAANTAQGTFEGFPARSPIMSALLEEAKIYAEYDVPILISGEPRLAKSRLAECIHNASPSEPALCVRGSEYRAPGISV